MQKYEFPGVRLYWEKGFGNNYKDSREQLIENVAKFCLEMLPPQVLVAGKLEIIAGSSETNERVKLEISSNPSNRCLFKPPVPVNSTSKERQDTHYFDTPARIIIPESAKTMRVFVYPVNQEGFDIAVGRNK